MLFPLCDVEPCIVGLVLQRISNLFICIAKGKRITCVIIGNRQYSADLLQGGLKVSCHLAFSGNHEVIDKTQKLLPISGTCI